MNLALLQNQYVVPAIEVVLFGTWLAATMYDSRIWRKHRDGGVTATIKRGDASMGIIHMVFGASVYVFESIVLQADMVLEQYSAIAALINLVLLVHLFYFNGWWRDKIVRLYAGLRKEN